MAAKTVIAHYTTFHFTTSTLQLFLLNAHFTTALTLQLLSLYFTTRLTLQLHSTHFTTPLNSLYNSTHFTTKILNQNEYYSFQNGSVRTFSGTYLRLYVNHCELCQNVSFFVLIINPLIVHYFEEQYGP